VLIYLDSSALVKNYFPERGSNEVADWIHRASNLWISEITLLEVTSALARKVRDEELTREEFNGMVGRFATDVANARFRLIHLDEKVKSGAQNLLETYGIMGKLRTLDALQLASAMQIAEPPGAPVMITADEDLYAAAKFTGLKAIIIR
jgi:predicted nucleic acid-binding protein